MYKWKKLPAFTEEEMQVELNKTEEKEFDNGKSEKK